MKQDDKRQLLLLSVTIHITFFVTAIKWAANDAIEECAYPLGKNKCSLISILLLPLQIYHYLRLLTRFYKDSSLVCWYVWCRDENAIFALNRSERKGCLADVWLLGKKKYLHDFMTSRGDFSDQFSRDKPFDWHNT